MDPKDNTFSREVRDAVLASRAGVSGLKIERKFTEKGESPYASIEFELRTSKITNPDGSVVFEMKDVEVPKSWSQVATDVLAQKYIRKQGVPQVDRETGKPIMEKKGTQKLGGEWSAKQVMDRLAGTWRYWGEKYRYFETREDAQAFEDEMRYLLMSQSSAPNSPQWFNTGLNWAYGITGDAQGHFYVDEETGKLERSKDAYTRPQPHACGRWDTKVMTEHGIMNLGSIVEADLTGIRTFDGNKWVKILATKENGVRKLFRMKLKNGQYIDFTDDHLIWAASERRGKYAWVPLAECLGSFVQMVTVPVVKPAKVKVKGVVAEAALAGFHIGDGYAGTYGGSTHFGVCTNDKDEFTTVTDWFKDVFGHHTVTEKNQVGPDYKIIRNDAHSVLMYVERYGLGLGSEAVRIHDTIFAAPEVVQRAFLRGLFQADGCVRIRRRGGNNSGDVCLTTISEGLAHDVQTLLLNLGIYSRVSICRDSRVNRAPQYHVEIAYESERKRFENLIGFISKTKINKLRELNREISGKTKPQTAEEQVVAIEYVGEEIVYDIQTESGRFLANGVVVHNCFIQSISDDLVNQGGIFDGVTREARLFKYGSGTGSNFSRLRGRNERLGGGGQSSGLMSFLAVFDRAAGAIKSGGTTRRAAKMVCVNMDHPEIEDFINWKVIEEQKVAALVVGSHICYEALRGILKSVNDYGSDSNKNPNLKRLILEASKLHVPLNTVKRVIMRAEQGMTVKDFSFRTYDTDFRSEAYATVGGQNSNNSLRVTNEFLEAVEKDENWDLINRTDGSVYKTVKARALWDQIADAAWLCADPGLQYDTTINEWHTCPKSGRINASNPCSEYMFLDDTACNLASLNLVKFYDEEKQRFLIEEFKHACFLWTIVLEISVLMAQFPSESIAQLSFEFRTLGLGYANIGTLLMRLGIPYDSEAALAITGAITALMCGESYATSALIAKVRKPFPKYEGNREDMLRVIRNHRLASYNADKKSYEGLTITPLGIAENVCSRDLLEAARDSWDRALEWGIAYGYRNAQVTVLAPTGTIGLVMDCDTTGIEPDFALVKFKKLVGGGYFKIVNQSVKPALKKLGYNEEQIEDIVHYVKGHGTLKGSPAVTHEELLGKGFKDAQLVAIEGQLESSFELKFAFNKWALGEDFCQEILGMSAENLNDPNFDVLKHLGFSDEEIEAANTYVCGTMTIEGAPHLKEEHYAVFDCANRCGKIGKRFIRAEGHIRMMAAAQPFISGAISKTINLPEEASVDDVKNAYMESWKYMLKANALYRDGSKLSQPLNTSSMAGNLASLFDFTDEDSEISVEETQQVVERIIQKPFRRKLPDERHSITHKFSIQGHEGYVTVGLYEDGLPGELFIKMSKEGSTLSGIMDAFALSVSLNLQYGVPLEVLVSKFTHSRFEPAGMTGNSEIPMVKSIMDYLGRWLALKFLPKETAKKYHNGELVDRAYEKGTLVMRDYARLQADFEEIVSGVDMSRAHEGVTKKVEIKKKVEVKAVAGKEQLELMQTNMSLRMNNADAPLCTTCGAVMTRNGTCYKCLSCGETSGCS